MSLQQGLDAGLTAAPPGQEDVQARGRSPSALAAARLRRNRSAITAAVVLLVIVLACLAAPWYAHHVAQVDPFASNLGGHTTVGGRSVPVIAPDPLALPVISGRSALALFNAFTTS